jgi:hypothetical protein
VRSLIERIEAASAAIDEANSLDPTHVTVRGATQPLALVHGRFAAEWVAQLHPDTDPLLALAAQAHHLRRWELPRSNYDAGKAGYLRWKRDQRNRHANDAGELLDSLGFTADEITKVQRWIRRDDLRTDAGSQAVEDAACLVFIETQLADVATKLEHDHLVDVIRKTAKKMSPAALAAVSLMPLGEVEQALLGAALGG